MLRTKTEKAISFIISHLLELQDNLDTEICAVRLSEWTGESIFTVENVLSHLADDEYTKWDEVEDD